MWLYIIIVNFKSQNGDIDIATCVTLYISQFLLYILIAILSIY